MTFFVNNRYFSFKYECWILRCKKKRKNCNKGH
jgi:hypothetical protein